PTSMTPKAFLTGRASGTTTARAVTLRMAGTGLLMACSSFDSVPPHQPRRCPVGCGGFDQIASRILGAERDALGLAGLDRQRIQPERFPAIVQPVEEAEMMAVEVEDGGDGGAVGQRQHYGAVALDAEGGRGGGGEAGGRHPVTRRSAKRQIDPGGVLEVEPFGEAVGGQWRGRREGRGADRRFAGYGEFADRTGFLAVMEEDRQHAARRRRGQIDEGV